MPSSPEIRPGTTPGSDSTEHTRSPDLVPPNSSADLLPPGPSSPDPSPPDLVTAGPVPVRPSGAGVPRTRTSAVWFGVWAGVVVLILLIVFVAQNTANVEVTFLWMDGSLPLALALLIAGVAGAIIAMGVAAARIAQLRRLLRRRR
jgi:uncharacterized integral membrane protein